MYSGEDRGEYDRHLTTLENSRETLNTVLTRRDVVYTGVNKNFPRTVTHSLNDQAVSDAQAQREVDLVNNTEAILHAIDFLSGLAGSGELDREKATRPEKDVLATFDAVLCRNHFCAEN